VDTPGAYPGVAAEQHGQGGAIARSQAAMARLSIPTVTCVIGEGGSGGAVALAVADRVLMQENAIYSVISPEGCAAILWRDAAKARKAAAAFKPDAAHCLELGVIDAIVAEPEGGAHTDADGAAKLLEQGVLEALEEIEGLDPAERRRQRRAKYRVMGVLASARSALTGNRISGRGLGELGGFPSIHRPPLAFPHLPQAYPLPLKPSEQGKEPTCSRLVKKALRFRRQSTGEPRRVSAASRAT
jgi:hypothetical protein